MFAPDNYFLALIIKEIDLQRATGKPEKYYVLYGPSSPLPWSGLAILYVKKEKVIVVKLSYGELYGISGSFGGTTHPSRGNSNPAAISTTWQARKAGSTDV